MRSVKGGTEATAGRNGSSEDKALRHKDAAEGHAGCLEIAAISGCAIGAFSNPKACGILSMSLAVADSEEKKSTSLLVRLSFEPYLASPKSSHAKTSCSRNTLEEKKRIWSDKDGFTVRLF